MLKTSKDFELAMYKILVNIHEGRVYREDFDFEIDETDCNDALSEAVNSGYITGIFFPSGTRGYKSNNARLTYQGLKFIETPAEEFQK